MATTFKFGNKNWAVKEDYVLAYNDENNNFKPLPFEFTRATKATYVDSDGLIKTANSGFARIDYTDNTDGHLLLEPSRTNLITNSKDHSDFSYGRSVRTVSTELTPEGSADAIKISGESGTTGTHRAYSNDISVTSGVNYTISAFVKKGTSTKFEMTLLSNTETGIGCDEIIIDFDAGTVNRGNIEDYGNEWYRISLTDAPTSTTTAKIFYYVYNESGAKTYLSDGGENVYVYGAQLEEGSYATSYIPTEGSSVTRNAELADENVITNFSGNSYTLFYDINMDDSVYNSILQTIYYNSSSISFSVRNYNGDLRLYNNKDLAYPVSQISSSSNKWVVRVDGTSFKIFGKDATAKTATLSTARTIYKLNLRNTSTGGTNLNVNEFKIYDEALTDAECEKLIQ